MSHDNNMYNMNLSIHKIYNNARYSAPCKANDDDDKPALKKRRCTLSYVNEKNVYQKNVNDFVNYNFNNSIMKKKKISPVHLLQGKRCVSPLKNRRDLRNSVDESIKKSVTLRSIVNKTIKKKNNMDNVHDNDRNILSSSRFDYCFKKNQEENNVDNFNEMVNMKLFLGKNLNETYIMSNTTQSDNFVGNKNRDSINTLRDTIPLYLNSESTISSFNCEREIERRISKDALSNVVSSQGASSQGASSQGAFSQGAFSQGAFSQGVSSQGVSSQGVSSQGVSSQVVPSKFSLSQFVPSQVVPYKKLPYKIIPCRVSPYKVVPSKVAPFRHSPYKMLPYKVIPYRGVPSQVVPPEEVLPSQVVSSGRVTSRVVPSKGISTNFLPSRVVPSKGTLPKGVSSQFLPSQNAPSKSVPSLVFPYKGLPSRAVPYKGLPSRTTPYKGLPPRFTPYRGLPSRVAASKVVAGQGITSKGSSPQVVPSKDAPLQTISRNVLPRSVLPRSVLPCNALPCNALPRKVVPGKHVFSRVASYKLVPYKVLPQKIAPEQVVPSLVAPSRDELSRDEPSRDEPSRDEPSRDVASKGVKNCMRSKLPHLKKIMKRCYPFLTHVRRHKKRVKHQHISNTEDITNRIENNPLKRKHSTQLQKENGKIDNSDLIFFNKRAKTSKVKCKNSPRRHSDIPKYDDGSIYNCNRIKRIRKRINNNSPLKRKCKKWLQKVKSAKASKKFYVDPNNPIFRTCFFNNAEDFENEDIKRKETIDPPSSSEVEETMPKNEAEYLFSKDFFRDVYSKIRRMGELNYMDELAEEDEEHYISKNQINKVIENAKNKEMRYHYIDRMFLYRHAKNVIDDVDYDKYKKKRRAEQKYLDIPYPNLREIMNISPISSSDEIDDTDEFYVAEVKQLENYYKKSKRANRTDASRIDRTNETETRLALPSRTTPFCDDQTTEDVTSIETREKLMILMDKLKKEKDSFFDGILDTPDFSKLLDPAFSLNESFILSHQMFNVQFAAQLGPVVYLLKTEDENYVYRAIEVSRQFEEKVKSILENQKLDTQSKERNECCDCTSVEKYPYLRELDVKYYLRIPMSTGWNHFAYLNNHNNVLFFRKRKDA
ncbi:conserved Plasmodium protein, unknown function [Plasmodium ovale]|uniref:Cyclin-dependent kinases regulatory subunit n=1 Tax=Plasmodium ovale TaxID=36330 RepID=A0A1C3KMY0_PLAOA|nr:conserved Plasmodium protein, unknown function [Plasmodium ovale]